MMSEEDENKKHLKYFLKFILIVMLSIGVGLTIYYLVTFEGNVPSKEVNQQSSKVDAISEQANNNEKANNERSVRIEAEQAKMQLNKINNVTNAYNAAFEVSEKALDFNEDHSRSSSHRNHPSPKARRHHHRPKPRQQPKFKRNQRNTHKAAFEVSEKALDFDEVHERTKAGGESNAIAYNNCKSMFDSNYPMQLGDKGMKYTSERGELVNYHKFREEYIETCVKNALK